MEGGTKGREREENTEGKRKNKEKAFPPRTENPDLKVHVLCVYTWYENRMRGI